LLCLILVFKNQAASVDNDKSPVNDDDEADDEINEAILTTPFIPEPVFFCSIEPPSIAAQKQVNASLVAELPTADSTTYL